MKTPHTCPVCKGRKVVPNGFYRITNGCGMSSDATPEVCKSCNGTGVLWNCSDYDFNLKFASQPYLYIEQPYILGH